MNKDCAACKHWNRESKYYGTCPFLNYHTKHGEGCPADTTLTATGSFEAAANGGIKIKVGLDAWALR